MTTTLNKMTEAEFLQYLKKAIPDYAQENVDSGRWVSEGALERSRMDYNRLLPDGTETKNNFLFKIFSLNKDCNVGSIWLSIEEHGKSQSAFIYDIEVSEKYRRMGFAKSGLKELEAFVRSLNIEILGLHVFRQNTPAKYLYKSLGFNTVSSNMVKSLA